MRFINLRLFAQICGLILFLLFTLAGHAQAQEQGDVVSRRRSFLISC
jgi:hypothetical protein